MPLRTSDALVRGIIKLPVSVTDLTPFMEAANEMVDELLAPLTNPDTGQSFHLPARLTRIETWLSAHFAAVEHRRRIQEGVGPIQATYEGKVDLNLSVTEYGQQAMVLDTSGTLARYNNALQDAKGSLPAGVKRKAVYYLGERD